MKKAFYLFLIISSFSCSKDNAKKDNLCVNYEKGKIVAGIKNTTSIEDVFKLCNDLNLPIDEMSGFFYTSPYPQDSLTSLINHLNTKPYLNDKGFTASAYIHYKTGVIKVTSLFFNMNINNQQDWVKTKKSLGLVDTKEDTKNIALKVPVGQEKYWLERLKTNSMVSWTELNCIGQIQPM